MKQEIIKAEMIVKDTSIRVMRVGNIDYISLTDLAKFKDMTILFKTGLEVNTH